MLLVRSREACTWKAIKSSLKDCTRRSLIVEMTVLAPTELGEAISHTEMPLQTNLPAVIYREPLLYCCALVT